MRFLNPYLIHLEIIFLLFQIKIEKNYLFLIILNIKMKIEKFIFFVLIVFLSTANSIASDTTQTPNEKRAIIKTCSG